MGVYCNVASSLVSSLEGFRALQTLYFKMCGRLACLNAMYQRVSNEIDSFELTRLLFLVHRIYNNIKISQTKIKCVFVVMIHL